MFDRNLDFDICLFTSYTIVGFNFRQIDFNVFVGWALPDNIRRHPVFQHAGTARIDASRSVQVLRRRFEVEVLRRKENYQGKQYSQTFCQAWTGFLINEFLNQDPFQMGADKNALFWRFSFEL